MYNWLEHSLFLYMCFFCNEQKTQLVDVSIMHNVKPIEWLHLYIQWQKISSSDEAVGYVGIFIVKHIMSKNQIRQRKLAPPSKTKNILIEPDYIVPEIRDQCRPSLSSRVFQRLEQKINFYPHFTQLLRWGKKNTQNI